MSTTLILFFDNCLIGYFHFANCCLENGQKPCVVDCFLENGQNTYNSFSIASNSCPMCFIEYYYHFLICKKVMFSQNGWMPIISFIVIVFFSDKYVLVLVELWVIVAKVFLKVVANVSKHEHET